MVLLSLLLLYGCSQDTTTPSEPELPQHTFTGTMETTQGGERLTDTVDLSVTPGPDLSGTLFRKGDGVVSSIAGNGSLTSASFSGISNGSCGDSFTGTLTSVGDSLISLTLQGSDCYGTFTSVGTLAERLCIDISGLYEATETGSVTVKVPGERVTQQIQGEAIVALEQQGCTISYSVPGSYATRAGTLVGNDLRVSGPFVIPGAGGDVHITENEYTAEVRIVDEYNFTFTGSGRAKGTMNGTTFSATGSTTGTFKKRIDVAVAVLQGGVIEGLGFVVDPVHAAAIDLYETAHLDMLTAQAIRVDPGRVVARRFSPGPLQSSRVGDWLATINSRDEDAVAVVLVGHSLGGDAVRRASFANTHSRVTIDPISVHDCATHGADQRGCEVTPTSGGRVVNLLASSTAELDGLPSYGLLGYRIKGAQNEIVDTPETNHFTILSQVVLRNVVRDEVEQALPGVVPGMQSVVGGLTAPIGGGRQGWGAVSCLGMILAAE